LVPQMKKIGVTELHSMTTGGTIKMADLEIYSLSFVPNETHAIEMKYPLNGPPSRTEIVEAIQGDSQLCSHNVLDHERSPMQRELGLQARCIPSL